MLTPYQQREIMIRVRRLLTLKRKAIHQQCYVLERELAAATKNLADFLKKI